MKKVERILITSFYTLFFIYLCIGACSTSKVGGDMIVFLALVVSGFLFLLLSLFIFLSEKKTSIVIMRSIFLLIILAAFNFSWMGTSVWSYDFMMILLDGISCYLIYRTFSVWYSK